VSFWCDGVRKRDRDLGTNVTDRPKYVIASALMKIPAHPAALRSDAGGQRLLFERTRSELIAEGLRQVFNIPF